MKKTFVSFLIIAAQFFAAKSCAGAGDITFWMPLNYGESLTNAGVVRNKEYFSIKLHSVFAYYKSGFLENIKQLTVASQIELSGTERTIQGAMLNKVWQRLDKSGDFIAINDHLAVLSPSTPTVVKIKISFRGVGEDKFKPVFDLLSDPGMKTALDLSPATLGAVAVVTPMVQKILSTPYTSSNPRQILDVEQSYVLYPPGPVQKVDALKEGYLVVFSAREKRSASLDKILHLQPNEVRIPALGQGLEYLSEDGWQLFTNNSFVVFSVTKVQFRGPDEGSAWFRKYEDAVEAAEKGTGGSFDKVRADTLSLWYEGNTLLRADPNFLQSERDLIKYDWLARLDKILLDLKGNNKGVGDHSTVIDTAELNVPANFAKQAVTYNQQVNAQLSDVRFVFPKTWADANSDVVVKMDAGRQEAVGVNSARILHIDKEGHAETKLLPGQYSLTVATGKTNYSKTSLVIEPAAASSPTRQISWDTLPASSSLNK